MKLELGKTYDFKGWSIKLAKGKNEVIKWQWRMISPIVFGVICLFALMYVIDWLVVLPVRGFLTFADRFENTITQEKPKGNRWWVIPIFLCLVSALPSLVWAIPRIISNIIDDRSSKRTRAEWDRLERERNRRPCDDVGRFGYGQYGVIAGNVLERQFNRRDTGSSYIDDMIESNVKKHRL